MSRYAEPLGFKPESEDEGLVPKNKHLYIEMCPSNTMKAVSFTKPFQTEINNKDYREDYQD